MKDTRTWEKEFDEKFCYESGNLSQVYSPASENYLRNELKAFISSLLDQARKEGYREAMIKAATILSARKANKEQKDLIDDTIKIPCRYCGKMWEFGFDSEEARGVFNVFCPDSDCEDKYSISL